MNKPRNYGKKGANPADTNKTGETKEQTAQEFKSAVFDELLKISADRILIIEWVREAIRMEIAGMANLIDEMAGENNAVWNRYKRMYGIKSIEITKEVLNDLENQQKK